MAVLARSRGSALVLTLLLGSLILVLGMALLSVQSSHRRAARSLETSMQAKLAAEAGLEDARVKLSRDPFYPDSAGSAQPLVCYTEKLSSATGATAGSYTVCVDRSRVDEPYYILTVDSVGRVGRPGQESSRTLSVTLDLCPFSRTDPNVPNPNLFGIISMRDSASP